MADVVKEINGRKYRYREYWDKSEKRVKWQYLGKLGQPEESMPKTNKESLEMAFTAFYEKCKGGSYAVQFDSRQLKRIRMHINEVLREYSN